MHYWRNIRALRILSAGMRTIIDILRKAFQADDSGSLVAR